MDLKELFDSVENHLAFQPDTAPKALALELGVRIKDIEQAVRQAEGVTFRKFRESKRLTHALGKIEERISPGKNEGFAEQRAYPRLTVPGAVVRYFIGGRVTEKTEFSRPFPILDISQGGMAFFANHPARPGGKISLLICLVEEKKNLRVKGKIIYTAAVGGVAGYRYRIGVHFRPFATGKGSKLPEIRKALKQLEKQFLSVDGSGAERSIASFEEEGED